MVRREQQLHGADEEPEPVAEKKEKRTPWKIFVSVVTERAFFRLVVLIALILGGPRRLHVSVSAHAEVLGAHDRAQTPLLEY